MSNKAGVGGLPATGNCASQKRRLTVAEQITRAITTGATASPRSRCRHHLSPQASPARRMIGLISEFEYENKGNEMKFIQYNCRIEGIVFILQNKKATRVQWTIMNMASRPPNDHLNIMLGESLGCFQ
jgi:hypothetical protein